MSKADGIPETRANIETLLDSLNLPELEENFQLVCDLKLANIILGIQSCSSLYSCPYCEGSKVDESGKPTNGRGRWVPGHLRTSRNISANQSEWALKTNNNRKMLKHFKSCEFKPIPLRKDQEDVAVLFQLPPDPLHVNLLGCGNDVLECLEKFYPLEIKKFYKEHNLKNLESDQGANLMVLPLNSS